MQRASFLIVRRCTAALQWETHQSCLLLQQNNIVTGATSAETKKSFFLPKVEQNGTKVDTMGKMWTQSNKKCATLDKN